MPTIQDILATKPAHIHCIAADATVLEATRKMNQHKIGALVVMENDRIGGIFTERDVLRRVIAEMKSPAEVKVGDVMTRDVICCTPEIDIEDASSIMKDHRVRHLPVCSDDGELVGMISIGDLNAFHASNQEQTIHYLHDYIYGRV